MRKNAKLNEKNVQVMLRELEGYRMINHYTKQWMADKMGVSLTRYCLWSNGATGRLDVRTSKPSVAHRRTVQRCWLRLMYNQ